MQTAKCPVCSSDMVVGDDAFEGDIMECSICDSISEITSLHPIAVSIIEEGSNDSEEEE